MPADTNKKALPDSTGYNLPGLAGRPALPTTCTGNSTSSVTGSGDLQVKALQQVREEILLQALPPVSHTVGRQRLIERGPDALVQGAVEYPTACCKGSNHRAVRGGGWFSLSLCQTPGLEPWQAEMTCTTAVFTEKTFFPTVKGKKQPSPPGKG